MKMIFWPVLIAILAQFLCLPLLIGANTPGEAIGWTMILALFFGLPSIVVYILVFGSFRVTSPPPIVAAILGLAIPAAITLAVSSERGEPLDFSFSNYVFWMGLIGGFAGTATYLCLRLRLASAY